MARIVGATLLILILLHCLSDRTAQCDKFHTAGFTGKEIRRCRCKESPDGRLKCPKPIIPKDDKAEYALKFCLCCKTRAHRTSSISAFCGFSCFLPSTPL